MIGHTLSHYQIIEKIGAGGMGEVYCAHDEQLDRNVALKGLPAGTLVDELTRRRFRREALALGKLNHPNIETVHEFSTQDGVDFLVMELVPGATLAEKLKEGPLAEREALRLGVQLAEGLAPAHAQGVVHRDLKPGDKTIRELGFEIAAMNFLVEDTGPRSCMVTTETRVYATDTSARHRFAPYWRVIYPGSALIRRTRLRAVKPRAEAPG